MKPQTSSTPSAPIALVHRSDIQGHAQQVAQEVYFLHSRAPKAAELVSEIKHTWQNRGFSASAGTDHTALRRSVEETAKNLLALSAADPIMKPYATRVLIALDGLDATLVKTDEEYAREQLPTDRNQIILDKIRELLA